MRRQGAFIGLLGLLTGGCSLSGSDRERSNDPSASLDPDQTTEEVEAQPSVLHPGREIRLDSIIDRVHFAFKPEGRAFAAGHTTHAATVDGGVLRVTPYDRAGSDQAVTGAPLEIETTAIYRGDALVDTTYTDASVDLETGRLRVARAGVDEEFKNFEGGVEQSWHFDTAPLGEGDLIVEVSAIGHAYVGTTDGGLHFATPGKLGFRYSHAVWVGADGTDVDIAAAYIDGSIRLVVPEDVLASTQFPAVLDPTVGAETAIDAPVTGWTGAGAHQSDIASNAAGNQFLVVWRDDRNGVESDIFGTRIGATGNVLDPLGIAITENLGIQDNPAVAFADGRYVVAWQEVGNIAGARVSTNGGSTALGNIAATAANEILPDLASRGATALLVYQSDDNVRGAIFNGLTFGATFNVANAAEPERDPAAAANPNGDYLVTWTDGATAQNIRGRLVTLGGVPNGLAFDVSAAAGRQNESASSFDGTNFFVLFSQANTDIFGTRVTAAGAVLDTRLEGGLPVGGVPVSVGPSAQEQADIDCTAAGCLAAWTDRRNAATSGFDIFAIRLNSDMTPNGAEFALSSFPRDQRNPAVVTSATGWLASWHDDRHGGADAVHIARVAANGTITDPDGIMVVTGNNRETSPTVAENASNWLIAWSDSRQFGADIRGFRVRPDGTNLDTASRDISTASGHQGSPDAARLDTRIVLAWSDGRNGTDDIFAARVASTGVVVDAGGIPISVGESDQITPEVASDGSNTLIVWADRRNGAFDIFGALMDTDGNVTVTDIPVCVGAGEQIRPSVAYDPANAMYLVAWSTSAGPGTSDVFGARVDPAGNVLDPCGVPISNAASNQANPDVTFGGGRFFVVWGDGRNGGGADIFGARVTATAGGITVLDPAGIAVSTAAGEQSEPVAVFSQNGYTVAWTDGRNFGLNSTDIFAGQVSTGGLASANFAISDTTETESIPAMSRNASASSDIVLIAYTRRVSSLDTSRVFHRRLTTGTGGGSTCSNNAQCETGFCVDGRCCDQACGGSSLADCQACSVARGAAVDGVCGPVNAGRICRNYATVFCDRRELCNGVDSTCPEDVGRREGQVCDALCGAVCPANGTDGAPHFCPVCPQ